MTNPTPSAVPTPDLMNGDLGSCELCSVPASMILRDFYQLVPAIRASGEVDTFRQNGPLHRFCAFHARESTTTVVYLADLADGEAPPGEEL
jgi:hypothetical protein